MKVVAQLDNKKIEAYFNEEKNSMLTAMMKLLVSKPEGEMQMEDYNIRAMGLDLSETRVCDKVVRAKATQKVVYTNYEKLENKLKKCKEELVNVKNTMSRLQEKIKGIEVEMAHIRKI